MTRIANLMLFILLSAALLLTAAFASAGESGRAEFIADLAVGYETGWGVSVFIGNGEGGFGGEQNNYSPLVQDITAADFDGDGNLDIAATDIFSWVHVYFADGTGGMSAPDDYPVDLPWAIASGDFDGINGIDLAVSDVMFNTVIIFKNNGSGGFTNSGSFSVGTQPVDIKVIDIEPDGDLDWIVVNELSNNISVVRNDGTGAVDSRTDYPVGDTPKQIEMADFDGDLIPDLAVTNYGDDNITVRLGDGSGGFFGPLGYVVGDEPWGIELGYFDNDAIPDLVVTNYADNDISILINDGNGDFSNRTDYALGIGASPNDVAVGNLNDDMKPDLVVCHRETNNMDILINNGSGGFPTTQLLNCNLFPYAILLDNFNDDYFEPATGPILVTTFDDAGEGSLRWAIDSANNNIGPDSILLTINSGSIILASPLPALTDDATVIIGDGTIIIDGSSKAIAGSGLDIQSSSNVIRGLEIYGFDDDGITVTSGTGNNFRTNIIYDNGDIGIDLAGDSWDDNDIGDGDTGPNDLKNYPEIDSVHMGISGNFNIWGTGAPDDTVDFYVAQYPDDPSHLEDPSGHGEAYAYVGYEICDGSGVFYANIPNTYQPYTLLTSTATDVNGNTSEFSINFPLVPGPLIILGFGFPPAKDRADTSAAIINLWVTDPNGDYIGKDEFGVLHQTIASATYDETNKDSVNVPGPLLGEYTIEVITEDGAPDGSTYAIGIQINGSNLCISGENLDAPASGMPDTFYYQVEEGYHYINGDANRDEILNILDITFLISFLYKSGPSPDPYEAGDSNCDRIVNILDITYLINHLYRGGPGPCT